MTLAKLIKIYGVNRVINTIVVDTLSSSEIKDLEYLENRITTHIEWEG